MRRFGEARTAVLFPTSDLEIEYTGAKRRRRWFRRDSA